MAKILLVDDEESIRITIGEMIVEEGHEVFTAKNVTEAFKLLDEQNFDVIVTDIVMPKITGLELLRKIHETSPDIPIVIMTGEPEVRSASEAVRGGAFDYLSKPISRDAITKVIRNATERKMLNDEKKRLEKENRNYKEHLEELVKARTQKLEQAMTVLDEEITERKRTEEALCNNEEKYRSLTDNIPGMVYKGRADWSVEIVTNSDRVCGYSIEEFSSGGVNWLDLVFVEDRNRISMEGTGLSKKATSLVQEYRITAKDGTIHWLSDHKNSLFNEDGSFKGIYGVVFDITERKQVEEAIRKSEERFDQVANCAGEWIWEVDTEGRYTYTSPVVEKLLGYRPDEVVGKKHFYDFFRPDEKEELKKVALNAFKMKESFSGFINTNIHKDGHEVIMETSGLPIWDKDGNVLGYRGADTDITEKKKAEDKLIRSRILLESSIESTQDMIILSLDREYRYMYFNKIHAESMQSVYGDLPQLGDCIFDTMGGNDDIKKLKAHYDRAMVGESHIAIEEYGQDTLRYYYEIRYNPIYDPKNEIIGVTAFAQDITERRKAEEKLREYSEHLEEMVNDRTRELKQSQDLIVQSEKLAALGKLAGGVSHELRNPMAAMNNAVFFLRLVLKDLDPDVDTSLGIMESEIERSTEIIEALLDFERCPLPSNEDTVDLNASLQSALLSHQVPENIHCNFEADYDLPDIKGNLHQMTKVFQNLILNAIQSMPEGGTLTLRSSVAEDDNVNIQISDTGIGIPEQIIRNIFEPFFTTKARGIGLGLSLARTIIEINNGSIDVESVEGEGSTFIITLPIVSKEGM